MFIAEQQLLGAAVGFGVLGKRAFASTFAAFFTRAYDQIRMAAISNATIHLAGSHAGVSDRRGRPVADGAGRPGHDAGRVRQHRPVPLRRQPDRAARQADGRPERDLLPPHHAREDADPLSARRDVSRSAGARWSSSPTRTGSPSSRRASPSTRRSRRTTSCKATGIAVRVIDAYSVKPIDRDDAAPGGEGHRRQAGRRRRPLARGRPGRRRAGCVHRHAACSCRRS